MNADDEIVRMDSFSFPQYPEVRVETLLTRSGKLTARFIGDDEAQIEKARAAYDKLLAEQFGERVKVINEKWGT